MAGAILCVGASPTFWNCVITKNTAQNGGAIHCEAGAAPTLLECVITDNTATNAGGGHQ